MRLTAVVALTLAALASYSAGARAQNAKPSTPTSPPDPTRSLSQTLTGPAKADYQVGKLLLIDGDFAGALIKLQSAEDTQPRAYDEGVGRRDRRAA